MQIWVVSPTRRFSRLRPGIGGGQPDEPDSEIIGSERHDDWSAKHRCRVFYGLLTVSVLAADDGAKSVLSR